METFAKLFASLLAFMYHCFDRVVILGHIPLLTRPENIVQCDRRVYDGIGRRGSESERFASPLGGGTVINSVENGSFWPVARPSNRKSAGVCAHLDHE